MQFSMCAPSIYFKYCDLNLVCLFVCITQMVWPLLALETRRCALYTLNIQIPRYSSKLSLWWNFELFKFSHISRNQQNLKIFQRITCCPRLQLWQNYTFHLIILHSEHCSAKFSMANIAHFCMIFGIRPRTHPKCTNGPESNSKRIIFITFRRVFDPSEIEISVTFAGFPEK